MLNNSITILLQPKQTLSQIYALRVNNNNFTIIYVLQAYNKYPNEVSVDV